MRKWLLLFFLAVADVCLGQALKEEACLHAWTAAKMPVKEMEKAGVSREDMKLYLAFWEDIRYFPLASKSEKITEFSFQDTWMQPRTYGGDRKHEGCDIFGKNMTPGYYPVVSMTDGIVEKVGWLPLGGWRIGIRSPRGGYFYYAHLDSYDREFLPGEAVFAGEILGFLGDSGYGEEGTTGKFTPHLHIGVYTEKETTKEYALNPYPMLVYLQKHIRKISY